MNLRFGLYLPLFGPLGDPAAVVDLAQRGEAAGWDGIFTWDHIYSDGTGPIADAWTTLAAIAQATTRMRFGPMVTPLPRRRPWLVARQAATLARLSGGRLILGLGLGTDEFGDFSRFGEPERGRSDRFDEGLSILRAMWSGRALHQAGRHYRVALDEAEPEPYPIPIWVASSALGPVAARRAAASDGIFPNPADRGTTPGDVAAMVAAVQAAGRSAPFDVVVQGDASPAWPEPHHVDLRAFVEAGMTWWLESLIHYDPLELTREVVDAGPPRP